MARTLATLEAEMLGPKAKRTASEWAHSIQTLERFRSQVQALQLRVVAAADKESVAQRAGFIDTPTWIARKTNADRSGAAAQAKLATTLADGLSRTNEALTSGDISTEHARVVAHAVQQLPGDVTPAESDTAEASLVRMATRMSPSKLRRASRRILEEVGRSRQETDAHQDQILRSEEDRARDLARLTLHDIGDGTTRGSFVVPTLQAGMLRKLLDAMTTPRRAHLACDDGPNPALPDHEPAHRWGLAFMEILEHLPTDRLSASTSATLLVTFDFETLMEGVRAATIDVGDEISATQVRRLACSANLIPMVFDSAGVLIDRGESKRLFTETQRMALATKYQECAEENCSRPYWWTELHHEESWSNGGRTDLANAIPLCGVHHHELHQPGMHAKITTDSHGIKTVRLRR